ncbi:hypothetical protein [Nocardia exalbida]|uniref:hypothetical protein n=1 Tax=Nocardia exalbida TaxID=290231 RepID=UPI0002E4AE97|nr:hypothetical protein [Nocardia exalbida]
MKAHRPAQVARHAAIVLAGAASLSLTVVAGAYVVQQIADMQRPATRIAAPVTPAAPDEPDHGRRYTPYPVLTGTSFVLPAAASVPRAAEPEITAPHVDSPTAPTAPTPVGGKVRFGDAYVGAQVAQVEDDTVSVTVDTNALIMLPGYLRSSGPTSELPAVTMMRTDLDTHSGEVRMAFSDPRLGEHDLRLNRRATPGPSGDLEQRTTDRAPAAAHGGADSTAV